MGRKVFDRSDKGMNQEMTPIDEKIRYENAASDNAVREAYQQGLKDGNDNRPQVIKYIDEIMPIIIHTCCLCHVELFRAMTFEEKTSFRSYCLECCTGLSDIESRGL